MFVSSGAKEALTVTCQKSRVKSYKPWRVRGEDVGFQGDLRFLSKS